MSRSRVLLAAAIMAVLISPGLVRADVSDDKARAEALLREAAALYRAGDRAGAVEKFEQAYAAYPSPVILYNLGKAYRGNGQLEKAKEALSRYLIEAETIPPARRREVQRVLDEIEQALKARAEASQQQRPTEATVPTPRQAAEASSRGGSPPVAITEPGTGETRADPLYTQWWLWAGVGAVVVGTVAVIAIAGADNTVAVTGTLGTCTFNDLASCAAP